MKPEHVCIIPSRGGSRRIAGKNIKSFHGKPMLAYAIDCARASGLYSRIVVSTDSPEVADVAVHCGAEVLVRPDELACDEVGTQEVMRHAVNALGLPYDAMATCLYPCVPLLEPRDLIAASHVAPICHYAISVGAEPLRDAGAFYMGAVEAFRGGRPLIGPMTTLIVIPESRCIDINTPEDWARAEAMYAALHGVAA